MEKWWTKNPDVRTSRLAPVHLRRTRENESEGRVQTFVDQPMRNDEGHVVDPLLDFKRIIFGEKGSEIEIGSR
ncbi:hypothetical protein TNCV_4564591 [Trichonephila clavipes]|nr:hypothetical protein TNCV_4564591 [Trichonephila clavipes]